MATSVTEHIAGGILLGASPEPNLGGVLQYYAVPKADGGYDYYRAYQRDEYTPVDIRLTGLQDILGASGFVPFESNDAYTALGLNQQNPPTTGGSTGYTSEQLAQLNTQHKANVREIEQAYQDGLIDYNTKQAQITDSRNSLVSQYKQGMESNNAYFNAVSPDAFQSQIGNYNQKVLDSYNQGKQSLDNSQATIDYAKQVNKDRYQASLAAENTFNEATGMYSGDYKFSKPVVQAPTINTTVGNPYAQAAKLGVPSWAPNYGGLSVSQKKTQNQSELEKRLYA